MRSGIVYKIYCVDESAPEIYVGSTEDIKNRESNHRSVTENPNSDSYMLRVYQYIRANGGWDKFKMTPIETMEFEDVRELRKREGQMTLTLNATLNCCIAGRTDAEWREDNKETIKSKKHDYHIANSADIVEKVRQWRLKDPELTKIRRAAEYQKAKEHTSTQQKQHRLDHPEIHKARSIKYRTEHADEIKSKKAQVVVCECGANSTYSTLTRHRKTVKHQEFISAQIIATPDIVVTTNDET